MITLTENAKSQMADICAMKGRDVVRYELNGGGCGGITGKWLTELHYEPEEGDITWSLGEDKVFVLDKFSVSFMEDGKIDYDTGKFMPAFKVTIPNKASCGCGESFVAT
jgi:iron-sulfur cluster assembly accessory protein